MICESHNLNDLDNTEKYRLSWPYGSTEDETINIQYCAAILRTVDLLQITRRRAPSVLFRLINPTDPISQMEWAKQHAVKNVRRKVALDRDGKADEKLLSDTVEVFATFKNENGFFGLNSYLRYCGDQLAATYNVTQQSKSLVVKEYLFPWRYIDDTNIQVDGFEKKPLGFEIDQEKILDLLTGHTLYNDSDVVLRELLQNSIDAVRLQFSAGPVSSEEGGHIHVHWDSNTSELTVTDNGTGMTQEIIENHLLKVGSSRYQEQKFRELNPTFSAISRFGIGVLSAFMVADSVEIVTVSPQEVEARQISLRSIHGKYLIKLLNKNHHPSTKIIGAHGTTFRLKFRTTARKVDIFRTARKYIMFPRCQITVTIDSDPPLAVGHGSPKASLEAYIKSPDALHNNRYEGLKLRVMEEAGEGITVAYAQYYSGHFRSWEFVIVPESVSGRAREEYSPVSTCVEGVAVEFDITGLSKKEGGVLAVVNAFGAGAPKTNVARSSMELTAEHRSLVRSVYRILFGALDKEIERLCNDEGYSLTWAVGEIPYLIGPVARARDVGTYDDVYFDELSNLRLILVEDDNERKARSLSQLAALDSFWTVESFLMQSVEQFIREARAEVTAASFLNLSQGTASSLPSGPIVVNYNSSNLAVQTIGLKFEVAALNVQLHDRRLDVHWKHKKGRWFSAEDLQSEVYHSQKTALRQFMLGDRRRMDPRFERANVFLPIGDVLFTGVDEYFAILMQEDLYLVGDTSLSNLLKDSKVFDLKDLRESGSRLICFEAIKAVALAALRGNVQMEDAAEHFYRNVGAEIPTDWLGHRPLLAAAISELGGHSKVFDPLSWSQRRGAGL
jgi:molecular chaperone HtpG